MIQYLRMQKSLGCPGCVWSDPAAIGKGPCCTNADGPLRVSGLKKCQRQNQKKKARK